MIRPAKLFGELTLMLLTLGNNNSFVQSHKLKQSNINYPLHNKLIIMNPMRYFPKEAEKYLEKIKEFQKLESIQKFLFICEYDKKRHCA